MGGDKPSQAETAARAAHSAGSAEAFSAAAQVVSVPPVSALTETSALAHGGNAHAPQDASLPASTPVSPAAPNTFAALDAESGSGAASWTRTGAQSVEAVYNDPSLGWVGVRADLSAAGVHAAVVPGSAEAAQALAGQMPGLHTYLSEQRVGVGSLTLTSPEGAGAGPNQGQRQGGNQGPNQGQNPGQDPGMDNAGGNAQPHNGLDPPTPLSISAGAASLQGASTGAIDTLAPLPPLFEAAGAYISVIA
jgi:hypothetical protein